MDAWVSSYSCLGPFRRVLWLLTFDSDNCWLERRYVHDFRATMVRAASFQPQHSPCVLNFVFGCDVSCPVVDGGVLSVTLP